eukprot:552735-Amphidinium_carterae.2
MGAVWPIRLIDVGAMFQLSQLEDIAWGFITCAYAYWHVAVIGVDFVRFDWQGFIVKANRPLRKGHTGDFLPIVVVLVVLRSWVAWKWFMAMGSFGIDAMVLD